MKKSTFTEEQITYVLCQAESGTPVADVCRGMGVSEATFYVWKKKYASMGVSELRKLRQLEDENATEEAGRRPNPGQAHSARRDRKKCMVRPAIPRFFNVRRRQFAQMYPASREQATVVARP